MKKPYDFATWKRENLEKLAAELTNEVLRLKAENEHLTNRNQQLFRHLNKIESHEPALNKIDRHFPEDDGC